MIINEEGEDTKQKSINFRPPSQAQKMIPIYYCHLCAFLEHKLLYVYCLQPIFLSRIAEVFLLHEHLIILGQISLLFLPFLHLLCLELLSCVLLLIF